MKRQAMVAGTMLESMQVFEILRSLELLRSLPGLDPRAITILGRGTDGVNGMYAALLDGQVQRVVVHSPTPSHVQGPHYLGVFREQTPRSHGWWRFWNRGYGRMAKCPIAFRGGAAARSRSVCNSRGPRFAVRGSRFAVRGLDGAEPYQETTAAACLKATGEVGVGIAGNRDS